MAPPGCSCNQQAQAAAKGKLPRVAASQVMAGHHFAYLLAPASLPVLLYNAVIACTMAGSDLAETRVQNSTRFSLPCSPRVHPRDRLLNGGCWMVTWAAGPSAPPQCEPNVSVQAVTKCHFGAGLQQGGQWAPVLWHPADQHPEQPHHPICQGGQPVPGGQCQPRENHVCAGGRCSCSERQC